MASNHNLEDMLNLALGTPEIGAVNFNYLYEVIHEILRHLGIANKYTVGIEDFENVVQAVSGRSTPLVEVQEEDAEKTNEEDKPAESNVEENELTKKSSSKKDATAVESDGKLNQIDSKIRVKDANKQESNDNGSKPSSAENGRSSRRLSTTPVLSASSRRASNLSERRLSYMVNGTDSVRNETIPSNCQDIMLVNR